MVSPAWRFAVIAAAFPFVSIVGSGRGHAAQIEIPAIPVPAIVIPAVVPAAVFVAPTGADGIGQADPGFSDGLLGFHTIATATGDAGPTGRWQRVLDRFAAQRADTASFCPQANAETCPPAIWRKLVATLATLPLAQRVDLVNQFFNRVPYVAAEVNWNDAAYWETPYEFLTRGGQCQDYAIAKFLALRESGVPEDVLRFVVVHDGFVGLDHAIVAVNLDGEPMALDNQMPAVTPVKDLTQRYTPYYSLNDRGWWSYLNTHTPIMTYSVQPAAVSFSSSFQVARY